MYNKIKKQNIKNLFLFPFPFFCSATELGVQRYSSAFSSSIAKGLNLSLKFFLIQIISSGYEWILAIYVISYIFAFVRLCIVDGPVRCFKTRTNW